MANGELSLQVNSYEIVASDGRKFSSIRLCQLLPGAEHSPRLAHEIGSFTLGGAISFRDRGHTKQNFSVS